MRPPVSVFSPEPKQTENQKENNGKNMEAIPHILPSIEVSMSVFHRFVKETYNNAGSSGEIDKSN